MALAAPLFYARPLAKAAISRPISAADGGGLRWRDGGRIAQFSEAGMSDNSLAALPRAAICDAPARPHVSGSASSRRRFARPPRSCGSVVGAPRPKNNGIINSMEPVGTMARLTLPFDTSRLLRLAVAATALLAFGATADARSRHKSHHRSHHRAHHKVQHRSAHISSQWTGCRSGDPDTRIAACSAIIDLGPKETLHNHVVAHVNRGSAFHAKGDYDRAIADYDMALQMDRRTAAAALEARAVAKRAKGDNEGALADYDLLIAAQPKSASALIGRADARQTAGDLDRAIADYDKALQLDKKSATAFANRGRAYRAKGDLDHALADYDAAVKLEPKSARAYLDRAAIHQAKGDLDHALADYDAAIARDGKQAVAYSNRGLALHAKGDFDKAIADFSRAVTIDPKYARGYLNRANAYRGKRELEPAKADLEEALRLDPNLAAAKKGLEEVNKQMAKAAGAEK
jgi:tetratricopeptide (TPR) repeat protein